VVKGRAGAPRELKIKANNSKEASFQEDNSRTERGKEVFPAGGKPRENLDRGISPRKRRIFQGICQ
jgi:hypothetical protein